MKYKVAAVFIIFFHQLNKMNNIKIGKIAIISLESWGGAIPHYMQLCLEIFGDHPVATRQGPQKEQSKHPFTIWFIPCLILKTYAMEI